MVLSVVLNSTNIVNSTTNSNFVYKLPAGGLNIKNGSIAVSTISQYFSTYNITSAYNNNSFEYIWVDNSVNTVSIPDGYYSYSTLNSYLEFVMITNGHYLNTSSGDVVYLLQLGLNTTYYSVELYSYQIDTTIASANTWTLPSSATWTIPTVATNPQFSILSTNDFNEIVGYAKGTIFPTSQTGYSATVETTLSTIAPQINPSTTYLVNCNLVYNKANITSQLLFAYSPTGITFGALGEFIAYTPSYNPVKDGQYAEIRVDIVDQLNRSIVFEDPNTVILLLLNIPDENK
jgi:hypothetical protein